MSVILIVLIVILYSLLNFAADILWIIMTCLLRIQVQLRNKQYKTVHMVTYMVHLFLQSHRLLLFKYVDNSKYMNVYTYDGIEHGSELFSCQTEAFVWSAATVQIEGAVKSAKIDVTRTIELVA